MKSSISGHIILLRLRWLQLRRALPSYGLVLLAIAVAGMVLMLHKAITHDPTLARYIGAGAMFMVFGIHQRRADLAFLQRHVPHARIAMALEYGALVLPVIAVLLVAREWPSVVTALLTFSLPWLPVVQPSGVRGSWFRGLIPAYLFEWKSMVQSTHPWSILLWLAALVFCWLPVLPLFLLGAIAMLVAGAQEQCEPRAMLLATESNPRTLLKKKVFGSIQLMSLIVVPVLIVATIFQPQWWWIHALFGLGMLVLVAYAIVLKYANYRPNERLDANGANVGVAAVFAILPGLSLVPLIMLLTEVPKARANLNAYFHDHHH